MKKNYIGFLLTFIFMALIAFLIASNLTYSGYMLNIGLSGPSTLVISYSIHAAVTLFMILVNLVIIKYHVSTVPWIIVVVTITSFYCVWFPLARENVIPLIQWIVPAFVTLLIIIFASMHLIARLRFIREEKRLNEFIVVMGKNINRSQNYRDSVEDDKKYINLVDGVEREEKTKYFDINYSIIEHDK